MVSLFRSSVLTVIISITVPQIPGVVRLVRSIVLSVREEPYVEAAVTLGTSTPKLLWRHVLPNIVAPLIVLQLLPEVSQSCHAYLKLVGLLLHRPAAHGDDQPAQLRPQPAAGRHPE